MSSVGEIQTNADVPKSKQTPKSMQTRWAVDTSVAIPALDQSHAAHDVCRAVVREKRPALAGHATFETYSVLTRMPGPLSVDGVSAASIMTTVFPDRVSLSDDEAEQLLAKVGVIGIVGGAVYDAMVGYVASVNGRVLLTRDNRAKRTYDLLGVAYEFVGSV